ncbi:tripartite tricarboxylate transporter substrate binding protein [Roseomonas sp. NAR14]|uniref:Tripartite tricarboxylate transporter substrate binding protein n=1 Tax=Roseomonas acroporae TaxID=2937791 RepID=A0A9X2BVY3_9PROT|nr:tripartite tricarboxylate transporter substrate binding protein [Roseomonas acroporae]MCK8783225.1 tripartite tricarboxylate transporter substrate binding protein [Roseomonas acroporae]
MPFARRPLLRAALFAAPVALAVPQAARRVALAQSGAQSGAQSAAAGWPERPVRVIVPFPGGSTPDIAARAVAAHFAEAFGQPFVADNRAGAGGNLGTDAIAKATDGHTIGVSINGPITTAKALYQDLPYEPARDLAPITLLVRMAQILVVNPAVPARDLAGFVAYARANPGKMSFGSVGAGSAGHLAMEDLKARLGIDLVHVPYRGFPQATLDLVAGRIEAMVVSAAAILPQIREGQARALAVTAEARIPQAPDVPTLAEAGVPDAASYAWIGLFAPATMPAPIVARLAAEARVALSVPERRATLERAGFEVATGDPAEFRRFIAAETRRWGGLATRLGLRGDS